MALRTLLTATAGLIAFPAILSAQEISAGAIAVRFDHAEASPLVGYALSLGSGTRGPFAVWQDARASGMSSRTYCFPTLLVPSGCMTEDSRVVQRIRTLSIGYAQPLVSLHSFTATLRPHVGWSSLEGRVANPLGSEHVEMVRARLGIGIEISRPVLGPARLFVAGDAASSLQEAEPCPLESWDGASACPRWRESRVTSTLRAGIAVRLR